MKDIPVKEKEAHRATDGQDMKRKFPWNVIIKTLGNITKKEYWKLQEKRMQVIYKGKTARVTADFLVYILKARGARNKAV